ncbi:3' terminal RNA ribose 2'-O-methyltransferase Hen1 [Isoptericola sp. NEAU-Y5]|uniref:Small RNA 2'-O-methyltransferase n=1 Tax=Isoptericola luteus TaxID=2879484 RepID=A0ABS7ZKG1_9MICO|nr:3' terminal RNA ribose 2'-O-methyltransferase Hen1 [Isoptericola sp. NEAU-Y5]MCA5894987.1 3' terminal RNA ribose 2'-O-methyltransferase Hen1 [Isoptericola sp. NEAU-Y5]
MLLTLTTTHRPATDLGHLLHKHPDRVQELRQSFGTATVFYPEASDERCTVALLVEIDPVRLARSAGRRTPDFSLAKYVNDRSYAASSLLGVALADVFSTARRGRSDARQAVADAPMPLEIRVPVLPCRGGPEIARRVFEPLGWTVTADPIALDDRFPEWGDSRYVSLSLSGDVRLADALNQLHVLLPVLDEAKHYWQSDDEVDKLLRSGEGWLTAHPDRELITRRYLGRSSSLPRVALARLAELDDTTEDALEPPEDEEALQPPARRASLNVQRHEAVLEALRELGARSVIDLGCGPGQFLAKLAAEPSFTKVTGTDVSTRSLQIAARRLHLDTVGDRQAARIDLFQGALTYEDARFAGFDAAVLMEVVEHVDPPRLAALERVVLATARPRAVLVTTPNREYNANYEDLTGMRHPDHRFEWSRAEFESWATRVAGDHGYTVELRGVGDRDPELGTPTQMAVFRRG